MLVRISDKPADIPGNIFNKVSLVARDILYGIVYINEEPVGQMALLKRGNLWWFDYLFIREDMRGRGILTSKLFPAMMLSAVSKTEYVFMNCQGLKPEDVERHRKNYGTPPGDILHTGVLKDGKPYTILRWPTLYTIVSAEPADIPGYYFKREPFAKEITYFIAYIGKEPVGQMALIKKGQWWFDYKFVREDLRGKGIGLALVKNALPFAAEITDHVWSCCEGAPPEKVRCYGLKMDVLNSGVLPSGKPFTLVRRHVATLRKAA